MYKYITKQFKNKNMKKATIFAFIAIATGFTSCETKTQTDSTLVQTDSTVTQADTAAAITTFVIDTIPSN